MQRPAVSVIVPIYGVEKYLRQCVESLLAQTLDDLEVILVDDASPDACPQMADEFAARDARVRVIHKPNGGYGHSCNTGLDAATGEYIAIAEPDDYLEADMYRELWTLARQHDADVAKSSFYNFFDHPTAPRHEKAVWAAGEIPQGRSFTVRECPCFLLGHPSVWSCIYKADFLKRHNIRFVEAPGAGWTDNPFQVQTMCLAERIVYTDKAYYHWRRLTADDASDLKDWTLPFKRSEEIHQWLERHHITDAGLLACLHLRELSYIDSALRCVRRSRHKELKPSIDRMLARMDANTLKNCPYTRRSDLKKLTALKKGHYLRALYSSKQIKRFLCSATFRRDGFCLQFLGLQIATPRYQNRPALFRLRVRWRDS